MIRLSRRISLGAPLLAALALASCGGASGAPGTPPPPPGLTLTQVLPAEGDVAGGGAVSLIGRGFASAAPPLFVHLGTRVVVPTLASDEALEVSVPAGVAPGAVDVRLVTGGGVLTLPRGFAYLPSPPPAPTLAFVPAVGGAALGLVGTRIDLTAAGFPPLVAPTLSFAGVPASNVNVLNTTQVRVEVPAGLPTGQFVPVVLREGLAQVWNLTFWSQGALPAGTLAINEFLANPGTLDSNRDGTPSTSGDEFIELVNHRFSPVDLTGCTLHDATALRHTFPNPTSVPAGGSIVVFGSGNPTYFAPRHASGHAQVASTGDLGLNNTSDSITLRHPDGTVLAQVSYVTADVTAGRSRNAVPDGGVLLVPAANSNYALHDTLPGALGVVSPGTRANGTLFP